MSVLSLVVLSVLAYNTYVVLGSSLPFERNDTAERLAAAELHSAATLARN